MLKSKKVVVTGGNGRFGKTLFSLTDQNFLFPSKKKLNILSLKSIEKYLKRTKPKYLIHLAGLSRPISMHEKNIKKSIELNIIGTSNIVIICSKLNIKIIYFSTSYLYPGIKGNYKETDPLLPMNNYAWSKLGAESAVQMYKNSLILRVCMTEEPFIHKKAFSNLKTNFIYHRKVLPILFKILNKKGIINLGGEIKTAYNFAKKENKDVKKIYLKKNNNLKMPINPSMNIRKLKKIINDN